MMNFICIKPATIVFLYFDGLWKQAQKTKRLYKYLKLAQELKKIGYSGEKKNKWICYLRC